MNNKNDNQRKYKKLSCPNCSSKKIIKRGIFQTESHGKRQRYFCKSCNKKFIEKDNFYRMRNNPQKITLCLDLFYKGVSTRQIQQHLQAFYPHNASWITIYKWIIKYSNITHKFINKLKIKASQEIQIDEQEHHRLGKKNWFIDSIDVETRYMVSSELFNSRGQKEIKRVLNNAKIKTGKQIKIVTTDGYTAYEDVIKKVYGYNFRGKTTNVFHNKVTQSKKEGFNHKIERLHNSIKLRTKTFRGFHGSLESAKSIMKGYEVYYNFIRKHQAIDCCPYELATDIKLENPNKWLELIELSS